MLTELGFLKHPPLEKIIEIAGSDNPDIQHAAFAYFSDKFDKLYEEEYDPLDHEGAFIPAVKDGVECVGAYKDVSPLSYFIKILQLKRNKRQGFRF